MTLLTRMRERLSPARFGRAEPTPVYGQVIAPPAPTRAGLLRALRLFALPAILFVLALDLAVWAIAELLFGACVAVWCAF